MLRYLFARLNELKFDRTFGDCCDFGDVLPLYYGVYYENRESESSEMDFVVNGDFVGGLQMQTERRTDTMVCNECLYRLHVCRLQSLFKESSDKSETKR